MRIREIIDFLKKIHFNTHSIKLEIGKVLQVMASVIDILTGVSSALDTFKSNHQTSIDELKADVQSLLVVVGNLGNGQDTAEIQTLASQINDKVNGLSTLTDNLKTVDQSLEDAQTAAGSTATSGDAGSSASTGADGSSASTGTI